MLSVGDLNDLSKEQLEQFRYVNLCDMWSIDNGNEEGDLWWTPISIMSHHTNRNNRNDVHILLEIAWLNGETSMQRLDVFSLEHPDMVVQYARDNNLERSWFFRWTHTYGELDRTDTLFMSDRDSMEYKAVLASRFQGSPIFKFGVEVPRSVRHAYYLDKINGDNLWKEAIGKELGEINSFGVFWPIEPTDNLDDYKKIPYHIVFDVKFDGRRKARLVCDGNWTEVLKEDIYSGVVGLNTVRLGFQLAAMNDLLVCAADVGTAFLHGYTKEKVYIVAGPKFTGLKGRPLIVRRGIYGLRSSATRFHEHLAETVRKLGFRPSKADADLYIRECGDHYEYLATYVDDILIFSKNPMKVIEDLKTQYNLKGVGEPQYYLGGGILSSMSTNTGTNKA